MIFTALAVLADFPRSPNLPGRAYLYLEWCAWRTCRPHAGHCFAARVVLMVGLRLAALQLTRGWHAGASARELAWRWAGNGFLVGFGFWVYPLIVSAIVADVTWIIGYCIFEIIQRANEASSVSSPC